MAKKNIKTLIKDLFSRINIQKQNIDIYCDNNNVSDTLRKRLHRYHHIIKVHDCKDLSIDFIIKFHKI